MSPCPTDILSPAIDSSAYANLIIIASIIHLNFSSTFQDLFSTVALPRGLVHGGRDLQTILCRTEFATSHYRYFLDFSTSEPQRYRINPAGNRINLMKLENNSLARS